MRRWPDPVRGVSSDHRADGRRAQLSGIKKLLMGGAVQMTMDAEVAATDRLKMLLETTPSG